MAREAVDEGGGDSHDGSGSVKRKKNENQEPAEAQAQDTGRVTRARPDVFPDVFVSGVEEGGVDEGGRLAGDSVRLSGDGLHSPDPIDPEAGGATSLDVAAPLAPLAYEPGHLKRRAEAEAKAQAEAASVASEIRVKLAEVTAMVGNLEGKLQGDDEGVRPDWEGRDGDLIALDELLTSAQAALDGGGRVITLLRALDLGVGEAVGALRGRIAVVQDVWEEDGKAVAGSATPGNLRRPLTAVAQVAVDAAWSHGDGHANVVVCSLPAGAGGSSVHILGKHFGRMRCKWLFDESVNAYMWMLQERDTRRCARTGARPSHFMGSFFFEKVH